MAKPIRYIKFEKHASFPADDAAFVAFTTTSKAHMIDVVGTDISGDNQFIYPATAGQRNVRGRVKGPKKFTGTIDVPVYTVGVPTLFYYGLGLCETTAPTTSAPGTHVIKNDNTLEVFRAAIGRDVKEHQYAGGVINGFTIDYSPDELMSASFDTIFKQELAVDTIGDSVITDTDSTETGEQNETFPDFDDAERAFGGVEVETTFGSNATTLVESASISIENNFADDAYSLGSAYLPKIPIGPLNSTGSFDLRYDNSTEYANFISETTKSFELSAANGKSSLDLRSIAVKCGKISYDVNRLPTDNSERFVQALEWTATPDANSNPIVITVKNVETAAQITG